MLIDPNSWSKDGATALGEWAPSEDGNRLVYAIQDGGTDWRTVKVLDVDSGKVLDDERRMGQILRPGLGEGRVGLLLFALPAPPEGKKFQSTNENQAVYFHKLGTPQSADPLIYATPDHIVSRTKKKGRSFDRPFSLSGSATAAAATAASTAEAAALPGRTRTLRTVALRAIATRDAHPGDGRPGDDRCAAPLWA